MAIESGGSVTEGPYSRVYWSVLDDKKFDAIRADMRHFGSWTLMLVVADMSYPAPAFIPPSVPKASLAALVDAKLVELLPARMYRIKGLKSERESRSERGKAGAAARWSGNATALRPQSDGIATGLLDETSKEEKRREIAETETSARDDDPADTDLFVYLAQHGAFIRPESGFGVRLSGLIDRRGLDVVMEKAKALDAGEPMSDRQWVFGLEKALEAIPSPPMEELPTGPTHGDRIFERMQARRLEYFQQTGTWPEDWGPKPGSVAA